MTVADIYIIEHKHININRAGALLYTSHTAHNSYCGFHLKAELGPRGPFGPKIH
jgi:hypothetical protein